MSKVRREALDVACAEIHHVDPSCATAGFLPRERDPPTVR
jgi:hypothetical protein